jgi:hypothetical protein
MPPSLSEWNMNLFSDIYHLTLHNNRYIPHEPTPKQLEFLLTPHTEALFGGAAGGGKSDALLMGALQYAHLGACNAILFRRSLADLKRPGALLDRCHAWLQATDAHWDDRTYTWQFPTGSRLAFGYLATATDVYRYQSTAYQYIGFDELTQFTEYQYTYLFSRLRRLETEHWIPLRVRSASNPGGQGHHWVKHRFVHPGHPTRRFIPATLADNPLSRSNHLHRESATPRPHHAPTTLARRLGRHPGRRPLSPRLVHHPPHRPRRTPAESPLLGSRQHPRHA